MRTKRLGEAKPRHDSLQYFADVCFLRLDFETFVLQGIGGSALANEGTCTDTFTVTVG